MRAHMDDDGGDGILSAYNKTLKTKVATHSLKPQSPMGGINNRAPKKACSQTRFAGLFA